MAETQMRNSGNRKQSSRLQRQAPASIQIRPADWKAAIPLLSPLITSPTSHDLTVEMKSCNNQQEPAKPIVFKKWQHPAAPFSYEPAPFVPFGRTGAGDR
ncbi:hypothetical protein ACSBR2_030973 [Camellia fascicularis]